METFFRGERITYLVLAVIVGLVATWGASTLTDSRAVDEHATEPTSAEEAASELLTPATPAH